MVFRLGARFAMVPTTPPTTIHTTLQIQILGNRTTEKNMRISGRIQLNLSCTKNERQFASGI